MNNLSISCTGRNLVYLCGRDQLHFTTFWNRIEAVIQPVDSRVESLKTPSEDFQQNTIERDCFYAHLTGGNRRLPS